jgi:hypothetical protein
MSSEERHLGAREGIPCIDDTTQTIDEDMNCFYDIAERTRIFHLAVVFKNSPQFSELREVSVIH